MDAVLRDVETVNEKKGECQRRRGYDAKTKVTGDTSDSMKRFSTKASRGHFSRSTRSESTSSELSHSRQ